MLIARGKDVRVASGEYGRVAAVSAEGYLVQLYDWDESRFKVPLYFPHDAVVEVPDPPKSRGFARNPILDGQLVEYFYEYSGERGDNDGFFSAEQRRIGIVISQTDKTVLVTTGSNKPVRLSIHRVLPIAPPVQSSEQHGTIEAGGSNAD